MKTLLEQWIKEKIGLMGEAPLAEEEIVAYQVKKIKETLFYAQESSPFWQQRLENNNIEDIRNISDIQHLPFTTSQDIRSFGRQMMCVSQSHIERVVTLNSSGTTGQAKRLFFTPEDLELTVDFFHHGMATLVAPGQKVLILMPGDLPGSVGDLLVKGLSRMHVQGIVHGPVTDTAAAIEDICRYDIDALVGIPTQVLGIVRHTMSHKIPLGQVKSVLLSADYVPYAVVKAISKHWRCSVFEHYGMSEMGLGGGLSCPYDSAYHLREADLYFEIVDPVIGTPMPEGHFGEVVFTTLTRAGMPLIRYRTGDVSRFLIGRCACGSILKRMEKVRPRIDQSMMTPSGVSICLWELDEALFALDNIVNFNVSVSQTNGNDHLTVNLYAPFGSREELAKQAQKSLRNIPAIKNAITTDHLRIDPIGFLDTPFFTNGVRKRLISDRRQ
ncbi:MAG: phenylacetate--CoA ligase family protein [Deltaproteobacteria bacterium]|nr:phenylacetate--CoA ligase family protein [Deltaproteobacteria bacterium]